MHLSHYNIGHSTINNCTVVKFCLSVRKFSFLFEFVIKSNPVPNFRRVQDTDCGIIECYDWVHVYYTAYNMYHVQSCDITVLKFFLNSLFFSLQQKKANTNIK